MQHARRYEVKNSEAKLVPYKVWKTMIRGDNFQFSILNIQLSCRKGIHVKFDHSGFFASWLMAPASKNYQGESGIHVEFDHSGFIASWLMAIGSKNPQLSIPGEKKERGVHLESDHLS